MRLVRICMLITMAIGLAAPAWGKTAYLSEDEIQKEIRRGIEQILDLWRDGRFEALYERTALAGKKTKEQFVREMGQAPLRPACCWEKIQELSMSVKGDSTAIFRAKLGFEGGGGTEFKTRSFKLVKEEDVWRMNQSDLLSLAKEKSRKEKRARRKKST